MTVHAKTTEHHAAEPHHPANAAEPKAVKHAETASPADGKKWISFMKTDGTLCRLVARDAIVSMRPGGDKVVMTGADVEISYVVKEPLSVIEAIINQDVLVLNVIVEK